MNTPPLPPSAYVKLNARPPIPTGVTLHFGVFPGLELTVGIDMQRLCITNALQMELLRSFMAERWRSEAEEARVRNHNYDADTQEMFAAEVNADAWRDWRPT